MGNKLSREELFENAYDCCSSELSTLPDARLRLAVLHALMADARDDIELLVAEAQEERTT
jgi:hypothetical protein